MKDLSILIPTYNDVCTELVAALQRQAMTLGGHYEIIVGDDGSTDQRVLMENRNINHLPHCRVDEQPANIGRAAIRNLLARTAQYPWLLFIDSDMTLLHADFLYNYVATEHADVIDGGVEIGGDAKALHHCLRYRYEKSSEQKHTAEKRQQAPYRDFHTANFLIRKDIMLAHPFDERFRRYGYEDVLFGKQLYDSGIAITHIDNPMGFCTFEDNAAFVAKTEEGLRTLHLFSDELKGYSRLLDFTIQHPMISRIIRCWHQLFGRIERQWLCGSHPSLRIFLLYRIGYFLTLK